MPDNALTIQFLHKSWGEKILFDDLSFTVERGQKMTLLGPEDAGKSTLLRILAGLDMDYIGAITRRAHQSLRYVGQGVRIAAAGQSRPEDGDLTEDRLVADEVLSQAGPKGRFAGRIELMADLLGLNLAKTISLSLSEGESRKIQLLRAVAGTPEVLLLDEPMTHLDPVAVRWLLQTIADYPGTVVVAARNLRLPAGLGPRLELWQGQIRPLPASPN